MILMPLLPELPLWVRRLGHFLPEGVRAQVFEPCCWDLLQPRVGRGARHSFIIVTHAVAYLLASQAYGVVDVLAGRTTRRALSYLVAFLMLGTLLVLLMPWFYQLAGLNASPIP